MELLIRSGAIDLLNTNSSRRELEIRVATGASKKYRTSLLITGQCISLIRSGAIDFLDNKKSGSASVISFGTVDLSLIMKYSLNELHLKIPNGTVCVFKLKERSHFLTLANNVTSSSWLDHWCSCNS